MAASPVKVLVVAVIVLAFEAMLFGAQLAEQSFPEFEQPDSGGFFGVIEGLLAVVDVIWGVVVFIFNLITFNVGGAPWWIRLPVGTVFGGSIVWSIATLIRGN